MKHVFAILAALACFAGLALPVGASTRTPKDLWATINVCDTPAQDNIMGVRASMPGDGEHTRMYMRFVAQYYDRAHQLWNDVTGSGVSKWRLVGSGIYARRQSGYTFAFDPMTPGQTYVLRGAVDFKWTKGRRIVRTAHVLTKGGHPNTTGAEPTTYSSALCEIT